MLDCKYCEGENYQDRFGCLRRLSGHWAEILREHQDLVLIVTENENYIQREKAQRIDETHKTSSKLENLVSQVEGKFLNHNPVGRKRTHTLFVKSRAWSSPCCGLLSVTYHGLGGQMLGDISYTKLL